MYEPSDTIAKDTSASSIYWSAWSAGAATALLGSAASCAVASTDPAAPRQESCPRCNPCGSPSSYAKTVSAVGGPTIHVASPDSEQKKHTPPGLCYSIYKDVSLTAVFHFHQPWVSRTRHSPQARPIMPRRASCICDDAKFQVKMCEEHMTVATQLWAGEHVVFWNQPIWPVCSSKTFPKHMNSDPSYRLVYTCKRNSHNITTNNPWGFGWVYCHNLWTQVVFYFVFKRVPKLEPVGHLERFPLLQTIKVLNGSVGDQPISLSYILGSSILKSHTIHVKHITCIQIIIELQTSKSKMLESQYFWVFKKNHQSHMSFVYSRAISTPYQPKQGSFGFQVRKYTNPMDPAGTPTFLINIHPMSVSPSPPDSKCWPCEWEWTQADPGQTGPPVFLVERTFLGV